MLISENEIEKINKINYNELIVIFHLKKIKLMKYVKKGELIEQDNKGKCKIINEHKIDINILNI